MLEMLKNWYSRRLSDPQASGATCHFVVWLYCDLFL